MCVDPCCLVPTAGLLAPPAAGHMEGHEAPAPLDLRMRRVAGDQQQQEEEEADEGDSHRRLGCRRRLRSPQDKGQAERLGGGGGKDAPRAEWARPTTPEGAATQRADRLGISLPPRKRPYREADQGKYPKLEDRESVLPLAVEQLEPPRMKSEPEELPICRSRPRTPFLVPAANGYPLVESVYLPYALQLPYYPGVSLPSSSFPICPVPTHPLPLGAVPSAYHPGTCCIVHSQEEMLSSDIAMATRQDEDGDTPLHIAVVQEDRAMVEKLIHLLQLGRKDLDIYNNLRQTPLHLAVITKQPTIISQLMANGASSTSLDRNGQTAAHLACEHSSLECLRALLAGGHERVDLEIRNYEGYTPLHVSVISYQKEIVEFLLDQGADIDAVDIKSGKTPLVHAVENNSIDMVTLLLQHGANVNLQTYSGNTALHCCSGRGFLEIVKVLLKNGADSSVKNCHNDTSLMVAKNKKVIDVLRGKACRTLPQLPPGQRTPCSVIKECLSPGTVHCPSPGAYVKVSPQPMDTSSPPLSHRPPEAQVSSWRRSPPAGVATRSQPETAAEHVRALAPFGPGEGADCRARFDTPRAGSGPGRYPPQPWGLCCPVVGRASPSAFRMMREEALRFTALRPASLHLLAPPGPEADAHLPHPPYREPAKHFRGVWLDLQNGPCSQNGDSMNVNGDSDAVVGKGES
ncbi:B-cell lymphoma 3 protein-like isoform X2 [Stegostoma tigrinum]|uniref:B-cell lymphoma 3 protein-like isoform X2 n=1 Tax=Stegostoma tigrinum TaxID=3053191 RepID=UPI00286FBA7A|nr:B-cell lymphoma 3 protein-like isoform X2 [Stegostoma tigrinum]